MSGIFSVLISIGMRIGRRISKTVKTWSDIPDRLFVIIGAICLFLAGYFTWQDQQRKVKELQSSLVFAQEQNNPKLSAEILSFANGDIGDPTDLPPENCTSVKESSPRV